jgi:ribosomal protein S6--L-glutamate ligase
MVMKIAILSRSRASYSTKRLVEAVQSRGHSVDVLDTLRCYMRIHSSETNIYYNQQLIPHYDAVIPRISHRILFYGAAVVRQFEASGVFCVNRSLGITRAGDKLRAFQLLAKRGIGLPVTGFASSPADIDTLLTYVGGAPVVIKLLSGTQGMGVMLANSTQTAKNTLEAFLDLKANILIQEYIEEAKGADIRCFVIGDTVIAAMKRQAPAGDFRSNLHRGGCAEAVDITYTEHHMAVRAARSIGLHVAGVDLLRTSRGPLVMEVNATPGLEGIEKTTGVNIGDAMVAYIEEFLQKRALSRTTFKAEE